MSSNNSRAGSTERASAPEDGGVTHNPTASMATDETDDERQRCGEAAASDGSSQLGNAREGNADGGTAEDAALATSDDELRRAGAAARATMERLREQLAELRVRDGHRGLRGEHGQLSLALAGLAMDELDAVPVVRQRRDRRDAREPGDAILDESGKEAASGDGTAAMRAQLIAEALARRMRVTSAGKEATLGPSNFDEPPQGEPRTADTAAALPGDGMGRQEPARSYREVLQQQRYTPVKRPREKGLTPEDRRGKLAKARLDPPATNHSGNKREEPAGGRANCGAPGGPGKAAIAAQPSALAVSGDSHEGNQTREEPWQDVASRSKRKKAARRLRNDGQKLPPRPPALGTVLFRPKEPRAAFAKLASDAIAAQLTAQPGVLDVRVNTRRNVVAADAATVETLGTLLATTNIGGIEVSPREPSSSSTGVIVVDDATITAETIASSLESPVPVQSAVRRGSTVYLRFLAPVPPAEVALHKLRRLVRPCQPRPLQCGRCGGLDHATVSCIRERKCWRCGDPHKRAVCKAAKPYCTNCGGPHEVLDRSCPRWQEERRVCAALVRAEAPASRVVVRTALRAAAQPQPPPVAPAPMQRQLDSSSSQAPGEQLQPEAAAKQRPSSEAAPGRRKRRRWSLRQQQEHLTLVLRSMGELLPADNPLRTLCVQAVQGEPHPEPQHG